MLNTRRSRVEGMATGELCAKEKFRAAVILGVRWDAKSSSFMPLQIRIVAGDITRIAVDAIVNAANETLLGGVRLHRSAARACP